MNKVYLIGIGGIGMSALARYYKNRGDLVAGYDRTPSKLTDALISEGIEISFTDTVSSIPNQFDKEETLVIYTPAVHKENKILQYFSKQGYNIIKRSAALGNISANKYTLAIAGTHGKTTTTTLLAHILTDSGIGCTAFLGGISKNYKSNLILSKGENLVAEADEFDRSFLQLSPDVAVITSTDPDHLDIYNTSDSMREAFGEFIQKIKKGGALILKQNIETEGLNVPSDIRLYRYSLKDSSDFYASDIVAQKGGFYLFNITTPYGTIKNCRLGIPGLINIENAIAASAAALLRGIEQEQLRDALSSFSGVERRFDIKVENDRVVYIDDYAHHPKELESAIISIKQMYPDKKITGIFQPHLYSRTKDFYREFAKSLDLLDRTILLEIYPARETPIDGISSQLIADNMEKKNNIVIDKTNLLNLIEQEEFEVLVTFGAGDIDRLVSPITKFITDRYNA